MNASRQQFTLVGTDIETSGSGFDLSQYTELPDGSIGCLPEFVNRQVVEQLLKDRGRFFIHKQLLKELDIDTITNNDFILGIHASDNDFSVQDRDDWLLARAKAICVWAPCVGQCDYETFAAEGMVLVGLNRTPAKEIKDLSGEIHHFPSIYELRSRQHPLLNSRFWAAVASVNGQFYFMKVQDLSNDIVGKNGIVVTIPNDTDRAKLASILLWITDGKAFTDWDSGIVVIDTTTSLGHTLVGMQTKKD